MKKFLPVVFSSLLSAVMAVFIYKCFESPQKIFIENNSDGAAVYTNFGDGDLLAGKTQRAFLSSSPTDFISAAERVTPAVVNIRAMESTNYSWWGSGSYSSSSGSGVIISPDGYIVTNNHVIEDGSRYEVTLNDRREFEARLIATDPFTDLALLKVEGTKLPFLVFGNSDSLRVGEWVLAVGNPFNLESTVTAGIVSAKGRNIDILEGDYSIESFIQTDAAVNPGNSGGALVNTNGELAGINTAIITRSGRYEGYSFAIPSNLVQKIIRDLRDYGEVQRALLGIKIGAVNGQLAKLLDLPGVEGVHVVNITPGGGADEAGMREDDVIVGINEAKISTVPELQEVVGRLTPGTSVRVEYIRQGSRHKTTVTLKDKNQASGFTAKSISSDILEMHGFVLRNLTTEERRRLRIPGVLVEKILPGSPIEDTEMDPAYIITKVGEVRVASVEDVVNELKKRRGKEVYLEGFYENYPGEYYYTFKVK